MRIKSISIVLAGAVSMSVLFFAWASYAGVFPRGDRVADAKNRIEERLIRELSDQGLAYRSPIFIRIFKEEAELEVWLQAANDQYERFRTYPICKFSGMLGPKLQEGDRQAPEGFYFVTQDRMNPKSRFHLSFNLGYPNAYDRAHGRTGSALMVHGSCVSIGCYAMTDKYIEEIYLLADAAFSAGLSYFRVHIFPFRMTDENLQRHASSRWLDFWQNLAEGYQWFELSKVPPDVTVENLRYSFQEAPR